MKTRKILAATLAAATAVTLAACASTSPPGGSTSPSANSSAGNKTIVLSFWAGGADDQNVWQTAVDMVHQTYPNLTVKLQTIGWNDYWTKLATTLTGSDVPCLIGMSAPHVQQFANLLAPLDDYMKTDNINASDFDSSVLKVMQSDGKQVAVPYDFGPYVMYYNRDLFKAAGLPDPQDGWTVADFVKDAKALTKGTQYGFALNNAVDAMNIWGPTIAGAQAVTESGKLDLTSPGMEKTLSWYAGLQTTDKIAAPLTANSSDGAAFLAGNAAMYASGPWDMSGAKTANFDAGIVTMPVGDAGPATMVSGSGFSIPQKCTDKDDAAKALAVITGAKALNYLGSQGRAFPARTAEQNSWYLGAVAGSQPVLQAAQKVGQAYRSTPAWNQISVAWTNGVVSVINGDGSADSFLQSLQSSFGN